MSLLTGAFNVPGVLARLGWELLFIALVGILIGVWIWFQYLDSF